MSSQGPTSGEGRQFDLKDEYIDAAWKQRWMGARAKYPEELIDNVGKVRGLFESADAPSLEDRVFIVCRTDPHEAAQVELVEAYSSISAANEHVLLLFAHEYGDSMDEECSWAMKGAVPEPSLPPGTTYMMWSFSRHACLSLEATLADDYAPGPRMIYIVEKWIETSPSEQLARSVFGR